MRLEATCGILTRRTPFHEAATGSAYDRTDRHVAARHVIPFTTLRRQLACKPGDVDALRAVLSRLSHAKRHEHGCFLDQFSASVSVTGALVLSERREKQNPVTGLNVDRHRT